MYEKRNENGEKRVMTQENGRAGGGKKELAE